MPILGERHDADRYRTQALPGPRPRHPVGSRLEPSSPSTRSSRHATLPRVKEVPADMQNLQGALDRGSIALLRVPTAEWHWPEACDRPQSSARA